MENLEKQAEQMWGNTEQYKEYKGKNKSTQELKEAGDGLMNIFKRIGSLMHLSPDHEDVQALVKELQNHITTHYYTCKNTMLLSLAEMYITDAFREDIDKAGGIGTAEFTHKAINIYCKR